MFTTVSSMQNNVIMTSMLMHSYTSVKTTIPQSSLIHSFVWRYQYPQIWIYLVPGHLTYSTGMYRNITVDVFHHLLTLGVVKAYQTIYIKHDKTLETSICIGISQMIIYNTTKERKVTSTKRTVFACFFVLYKLKHKNALHHRTWPSGDALATVHREILNYVHRVWGKNIMCFYMVQTVSKFFKRFIYLMKFHNNNFILNTDNIVCVKIKLLLETVGLAHYNLILAKILPSILWAFLLSL